MQLWNFFFFNFRWKSINFTRDDLSMLLYDLTSASSQIYKLVTKVVKTVAPSNFLFETFTSLECPEFSGSI